MATITVFNQKGGVGKTTTALNLLAAIAQRGYRPSGIDLDPQGHLSGIFGVKATLADESVYSFFARERPLPDIACISKSGVVMVPSHLELSKLDALLGKSINVRESAVLGLVGAGGIGMALDAALNLFQWPKVALILAAILAIVVVAEVVVTQVRKRVL